MGYFLKNCNIFIFLGYHFLKHIDSYGIINIGYP